jgi:hypothetical protein
MRIKIRCKKCRYETEVEVRTSPAGSLRPGKKNPLRGIKLDKDSLDKLAEAAKGASREDLEKIGIYIDIEEWQNAMIRQAIRKFILDNLKVTKEEMKQQGEKYVVATEPWRMGDSFRDVDLASSETKSMGVDDLRLIPGLTMQKKVYGTTKGRETERLHGIKMINMLDGSGSMIEENQPNKGKIGKALMITKETWEICKKLAIDYQLGLFSDRGQLVPRRELKNFFEDAKARGEYSVWNGGTNLKSALDLWNDADYKDANVLIISDMDIADFKESQQKIIQICKVTNSFKIILIESGNFNLEEREAHVRELFPQDINLKVMVVNVSEDWKTS